MASELSSYDKNVLEAVITAPRKKELPAEIARIVIELLRKEKPQVGPWGNDDFDNSLEWQVECDKEYKSVYNESTGKFEIVSVSK